MSTNLEIESKSMLSKSDYEKLISIFGSDKIYEQVNYYIDTKSCDLIKRKCGLRIRTLNDKNEFTLKVPNNEGKLEINQQISDKQVENAIKANAIPDGEIKDYLVNVLKANINDLKVLGKLTTKRLDLYYNGSLISIDESNYNGLTDYEIEAEDNSMKKAESNLKQLLKENEIEFKQSRLNKIERFIESL